MAKAKSKETTTKSRTAEKPAPVTTAHGFDGERLVALLGAPMTDPRIAEILRELGYTKPVNEDVELKKLGIGLSFQDDQLRQVRFELRRRWTGCAKYEGRLPYDLSPDLRTKDQATVLADRAPGEPMNDTWYSYKFPTHTLSMGFGKTYVETVFVYVSSKA